MMKFVLTRSGILLECVECGMCDEPTNMHGHDCEVN